MINMDAWFWILNIVIGLLVGFIAGTLAGSDQLRFKIFGKIFSRKLLKKPLISARSVCCKNYICEDGLLIIYGLSLINRIPFIHVSDCWVQLVKTFASWVMHWQAHYDERFSKSRGLGKTEYYNGPIDELLSEYAATLDKYARYPKSTITLPRDTGRIVEILAEIHRWSHGQKMDVLKQIVESGKGEYHLMISEPDETGNARLTPVPLQAGWSGKVVLRSDEFGLLQIIDIEIPKSPKRFVDWHNNQEITKSESKDRGQPIRLEIKCIH